MLFRSDRKSTRLNSSHTLISYAVFCLKKKKRKYRRCRIHKRVSAHSGASDAPQLFQPYLLLRPRVLPDAACLRLCLFFFFFNDTAPPEIYPLPLPDALPIFLHIVADTSHGGMLEESRGASRSVTSID